MYRVLYVEGDQAFRKAAASRLVQESDLSVTTAGSAAAGLDLLSEVAFDIVLAGHRPPGQDGIAFLGSVRARDPAIPGILILPPEGRSAGGDAPGTGALFFVAGGTASRDPYGGLPGMIRDLAGKREAGSGPRQAGRDAARQAALPPGLLDCLPGLVSLRDPGGRYLGCNPAFAAFAGREQDAVAGCTDADLFPREVAVSFRRQDLAAAEAGTPQYSEEWLEYPDGRRILADTVRIPLGPPGGPVTGLLCISRDITEKKRAEDALRGSEGHFRAIVENAGDIVFTLDPDGRFTYVSPNWRGVLGHPAGRELPGPGVADAVHPDDRAACLEAIGRIRSTGLPGAGIGSRVLSGDGSWRWLVSNAAPLRDDRGTVTGILGIARDVTGPRLAEQAVHEANRKLNILNSITRHDVINQVAALEMLVRILEDTVTGAEAKDAVALVAEVTGRIARQIEFTKEYQDVGVLAPQWQDVPALIAEADRLLGSPAFRVETGTGPLEIYADPLLGKVFYNLLENAVRHGGHVTRIAFTAQEYPDRLVIAYQDDGVGFDAVTKKNLFRRGFGRHTGFGLYLMREILSITGIAIEAAGEPGKGARFELTVPKGSYRTGPAAGMEGDPAGRR